MMWRLTNVLLLTTTKHSLFKMKLGDSQQKSYNEVWVWSYCVTDNTSAWHSTYGNSFHNDGFVVTRWS